MTPLEKAARALCELDGNPPGAVMDGKPLWQDFLPEVRTVLQAIREPSEEMEAAADALENVACASGDSGDGVLLNDGAERIWQAMIDAALA